MYTMVKYTSTKYAMVKLYAYISSVLHNFETYLLWCVFM